MPTPTPQPECPLVAQLFLESVSGASTRVRQTLRAQAKWPQDWPLPSLGLPVLCRPRFPAWHPHHLTSGLEDLGTGRVSLLCRAAIPGDLDEMTEPAALVCVVHEFPSPFVFPILAGKCKTAFLEAVHNYSEAILAYFSL